MVSEDFEVGDLVWAKMKGYPPWPGKVEEPSPDAKPPKNKKAHFIYFFGTKNFAWILDENISPHEESFLSSLGNKKTVAYQNAIEELINFSKNNLKDKHPPKNEESKSYSKKSPAKVFKVASNTSKKVDKKAAGKNVKKVAKKRVFDSINGGYSKCTPPKCRKLAYGNEYPLVGITPPAIDNSDNTSVSEWDINDSIVDSFFTNIEQGRPSSLLHAKDISPSAKKIGFIGLGHVGRAVVQSLLTTGHDVTVWNRTSYKCDALVSFGAKKARSPAELIVTCDITFCSVSDPDASKSIIFGERGVLKGLEQAENLGIRNRGYVEMSSLDPETSMEIAEAIGRKNGKYLETPISGNSDDALNGKLLILAAGDRRLFLDCESCFHVLGKHAYYVSCMIGVAGKYSLLLSSFLGTMYAAAAECLSLSRELKLEHDIFLDILSAGPFNCESIAEKSKRMLKFDFRTVTPLKYMQKDLSFALMLGNQCNQPMPVIAAANEVYKRARLLQYSDSDVCAVIQGVRN